MSTNASDVTKALEDASSCVVEQAGIGSRRRSDVEICLSDLDATWRLSWDDDEKMVRVEMDSSSRMEAVRVRTTTDTLSRLASGRLSPLAAIAGGLIQLELAGFEREAAAWCFPMLKAAGLRLTKSFCVEETELLNDLRVSIVGERIEGGVLLYEIKVSTSKGEWTTSRRYSQFRALWLDLSSALRRKTTRFGIANCGREEEREETFPEKRGPLASRRLRRAALESWLRTTCRDVSVDVATKLYPFLDVPRDVCETVGRDRLTQAEMTRRIRADTAGLARSRTLLRARKAEKQLAAASFSTVAIFWKIFKYASLAAFVAMLLLSQQQQQQQQSEFGRISRLSRKIVAALACLFAPLPVAYLSAFFMAPWWYLALRLIMERLGLMRALHVYATASFAISAYVLATVWANRVLNIPKETPERDAYFNAWHKVVAPIVADRMAALKSIWVKLGQYISARADVVPKTWNESLRVLQDDLPADTKRQVDLTLRECGISISAVFNSFDYTPLASASVAQVHSAYYQGRRVAVKVQHRGVAELFCNDIRRAINIAQVCSKLNSDFETTVTMLKSWQKEIWKELDFKREAANASRARRCMLATKSRDVVVPPPIDELVNEKVFAMDFFEPSFKVDDEELLSDLYYDVDKTTLCEKLAHAICYLLFDQGFCNCDPHPGNVLVGPNPDDDGASFRIALLDWGWAVELDHVQLSAWRDLVIALKDLDVSEATSALRRLGYKNSQDNRVPERSVQFFAFLLRDTSGRGDAQAETKSFFESRKAQRKADEAENVREKKGRTVQSLPETFIYVIRTIGAFRGIAAHLGVNLPLSDIMAHHAKVGKARDAATAAASSGGLASESTTLKHP